MRWRGRWSIEAPVRLKGLLMVAVPLAALGALGLSIRWLGTEQRSAFDQARQAARIQQDLRSLEVELASAETALRDYLLTGRQESLEPYRTAREYLPARLADLEKLLDGNASRSKLLERLRPVVERDLEVLQNLRQYAALPNLFPANPPEKLMGESAAATVQVRRVLGELQEEEESRLQRASMQALRAQDRSEIVVVGTLLFGFLGGIAAAWLLVSHVVESERRRVEAAVSDSQRLFQELLESTKEQARELARSEEALRNQTRVLQSVLDGMSDGVVVARADGGVILSNEAAGNLLEDLAHTPPAAWTQRYGLRLADEEAPCPEAQLPLERALRGEEVDRAVLLAAGLRPPEGVWLSMTARPIRAESGLVEGAALVLTDITMHKRNEQMLRLAKEEAERANRAKSDFLSRMSHELRTPLNAILGFAQLLQLARLKTGHRDNVEQILKAGRHLLALINEVLDISRIESGGLALSPEPVCLAEVAGEAITMVQPQAAAAEIRLHAEPVTTSGLYVLADRQRLKQVLLNLLSNAVKYNRPGGAVTFSCQEIGDQRVILKVSDTGIGIAAHQMGLLFSPFERLGAEQTGVEGTGIGLVLTKRLVEAMGGKIGVESQVKLGTTFWLELPRTRCPLDEFDRLFSAQLAATAEAVAEDQDPAVLCIEDNPSNLQLIERILAEGPKARLLTALHGAAGLELARENRPDLILLDVHLPDMDGGQVLMQLKADPRTSGIPVVVVSADATPQQIERLRGAGARDYLTKPLDVQKLLGIVKETLEHADAL